MTSITGTGKIRGKEYTDERPYKVDLTPVEEFVGKLESTILNEGAMHTRELTKMMPKLIEEANKMDEEQLRYLTTNLVGIIGRMTDLYQSTLDNPEAHLKFVKEYRKLESKIKEGMKELGMNETSNER